MRLLIEIEIVIHKTDDRATVLAPWVGQVDTRRTGGPIEKQTGHSRRKRDTPARLTNGRFGPHLPCPVDTELSASDLDTAPMSHAPCDEMGAESPECVVWCRGGLAMQCDTTVSTQQVSVSLIEWRELNPQVAVDSAVNPIDNHGIRLVIQVNHPPMERGEPPVLDRECRSRAYGQLGS